MRVCPNDKIRVGTSFLLFKFCVSSVSNGMNISETSTNILSKHSQHGLTSSWVDMANGNARKQEGRSILYILKGSWKTNKKGENETVNKKWDIIKSCDPAVHGGEEGKGERNQSGKLAENCQEQMKVPRRSETAKNERGRRKVRGRQPNQQCWLVPLWKWSSLVLEKEGFAFVDS